MHISSSNFSYPYRKRRNRVKDVPYHYYTEPNSNNPNPMECKYYMKSESRPTTGHKLITEKAIFARWATRRHLQFLWPKWNNLPKPDASVDTWFIRFFSDKGVDELKSIKNAVKRKAANLAKMKKSMQANRNYRAQLRHSKFKNPPTSKKRIKTRS